MRKLCMILSALVLIVLCVTLMSAEAQAAEIVARGTSGDNVTWTLDTEGVLTINGSGDMPNWDIFTYGNKVDYSKAPPWYDYNDLITKAVIQEGITSIGDWAFSGCINLPGIEIPDSVTRIGYRSFYCCTGLTSISIPDGVMVIGEGAFGWCRALKEIYLPNSVTDIYSSAFSGCYALTNIRIPDKVTYISPWLFSECINLSHVELPANLTSIGMESFMNCGNLREVTIPEGVTIIGYEAFKYCWDLSSVAIPKSVTQIEQGAFEGCEELNYITYCGTVEQWNQIDVADYNAEFKNLEPSFHMWDTRTKEPTYTAMGERVTACVYCGEVKETISIPAKFYGTSVNLGNTLDMYFGFYTGLVDEGGKVVFVREFADGTTETTEAPITAFNKNNSVYDITYTGLAAKEMCDTIHVYVYNGEGTLVGQHSDSIRSYILRQLREKEHEQEFRTLCIDLLNYGAAAQEAFGYGDDDLANKDLTTEELAEGTQTADAYTDKQVIIGDATSYYGTAYILETKISMLMAVRADRIGADCYALVSYTDHTGNQKSNIRVEGKKNYSVYEFELNEIVVADGRCLLTIEFYKADGTKVLTVQDSMESYTARNAAEYPLAGKMLAFSDSAYKYLHRNDQ